MQNAIVNNQIINGKSFKKLLKNLKKIMPIEKKEQLDADTIIERLNLALSFDRPVKMQINCEAYSDRVMNFSGKLIQTNNGNLLIQSKNDLTKIHAAQIRHLKLIRE
ncbi:hypothetical protein [Oenococcus kitaharae]|uniref:YolD-like protein n=1 Tax=Oenococcus kitaharae DSM 17330 TaxID=1045004 RepID=G9WFK9_9LACO|nr:hypothetical protein [Oenococcus kitaharae]EHN59301.1 hypothetical protein OKIT_1203 [Oenococcus kitaharae DSM 17330]MCV3296049.1 hypothetical protein [Oenococcus kitaharae]OEY82178.1 hypothetical protein NT96_07320 [Oenococcus kitaharae]OEY82601.1 hypothetical protein NV75_07765 [Oenococcus kitaharae]OEY84857.1 hypothetical protein NT95_00360 [Oenococcus kitaharae]